MWGGVKFYDVNDYMAKVEINLSEKDFNWNGKDYNGYFDAIMEVMAMDDSDSGKSKMTTDLAKAIAGDLAQSTYDALNSVMTNHFDRAIQDPKDPYSVYIYDYRDTDAVSPGSTISQDIWTYSSIEYDYDREVDGGYYTHYDYWDANQIWIQASDEVGDGIPIYSQYLSAEVLKLQNYRVDTYASEMIWEDEEAYQKRLLDWLAKIPEPKKEIYQQKFNVHKQTAPAEFRVFYENGEPKKELIKPATYETTEEVRDMIRYVYDENVAGPKPIRKCDAHEVYAPSELSLLDEAFAKVMRARSYYGAVQNRLEHTYNNNYNADENITYAESRIRDTDMSKEMVRNSMLNILQQAGLSMLTQANQMSQSVNMLLS